MAKEDQDEHKEESQNQDENQDQVDNRNREENQDQEGDREQNRHYDIICLTVTTITGATLAAIMLLSDAPDILLGKAVPPSSLSEWIPTVLAAAAVGAFPAMTIMARLAIFQRSKPNLQEYKRRLTSRVFDTLIGIALALAVVTLVNLGVVAWDALLNGENESKEKQEEVTEGTTPTKEQESRAKSRPAQTSSQQAGRPVLLVPRLRRESTDNDH